MKHRHENIKYSLIVDKDDVSIAGSDAVLHIRETEYFLEDQKPRRCIGTAMELFLFENERCLSYFRLREKKDGTFARNRGWGAHELISLESRIPYETAPYFPIKELVQAALKND